MNFCAYILKRSHTVQSQLKGKEEKGGGGGGGRHYLMAEPAAAGAEAETAAAGCNNPALNRRWDPCLSPSLLFSVSLSFFLLNHCSNKLPCILSPFVHRRFSQPGSQQTALSSWKRSASLLRNAWTPLCGSLHVYPSDQWCSRSGWSSTAAASGQPMGAQDSLPVISPPSKQNTACLWHIAELWKVIESCIWNGSCLFFFPPSVHRPMLWMNAKAP